MTDQTTPAVKAGPPPLTWRLLRLHHVRPNGWQRALVNEGIWTLAAILTLADVASAWTLVVLPAVALAVLKAHDVLAGFLPGHVRPSPLPPPHVSDYLWHLAIVVVVLAGFALPSRFNPSETLALLVIDGMVAVAIFRYLRARGSTASTATVIASFSFLFSPLIGGLAAALEARRLRRTPVVPPPPPPATDDPTLADQLAPYDSIATLSPMMAAHMRTAPDPEGADAADEAEELSPR